VPPPIVPLPPRVYQQRPPLSRWPNRRPKPPARTAPFGQPRASSRHPSRPGQPCASSRPPPPRP
jgi:hypothetical protein